MEPEREDEPGSTVPSTMSSFAKPEERSRSRKRAAPDFSPGLDAKKIGAEISEEKARQLENDITRLSPVDVGLEEVTLNVQPPGRQLLVVLSRLEVGKSPQKKRRRKKKHDDEDEEEIDEEEDGNCSNRFTVERLGEDMEVNLENGEPLKVTMQRVARKLDLEETESASEGSEDVSSTSQIEFQSCAASEGGGEEVRGCQESDLVEVEERRLELERPEVFTEDSAESLGTAAGAGDEVRSDGSDSGLGSEVPGELGVVPTQESDSETSFLDKIPEDVLGEKDDGPNIPASTTPSTQRYPIKSNLKRRLSDCLNEDPKKSPDSPTKKKRNIHFDAVTVYYFPRSQGFTCVPSQGGSTLGMSAMHTHAERYSLSEHAAEQRRVHRARLAQLRSERAANCIVEGASSSEDPSDDTDEEPSDPEELDIDSYYFLQPVPTWQRRALLRAAGVRRIDAMEKDECRDIRASREHCGCSCKGYCDPESCPCSRANVKCQVDRAGFPCGCSRDGCANSSGRIEFNPVRVRTHFIHTLMRLEIEKKPHDEDRVDVEMTEGQAMPRTNDSLHEIGLMETPADSCVNPHPGNEFTALHYESQDNPHRARDDSLDLYATRNDCYGAENATTDAGQRSTFPGFSQNADMAFQQNSYGDYSSYQNLPSTSSASFQCRGFPHYSMPYGQNAPACDPQSNYEAPFAQDDASGSQYTNLNSVQQPLSTVVHQLGKLEPFSELLSGRYSYYDSAVETTPVDVVYEKTEDKATENTAPEVEHNIEDCDENFGEIIKKSMVETVSA